jgi:hypothetical protein
MRERDRVKLLGGPYWAPRLRVGDVTRCLYRDRDVIITGWSDAPIPWPRCRPRGGRGGGGGLLVDEELARAIRTESAAALMHHWGVGVKAVWNWRRCFAIGRTDTPGSARLVQAAAEKGADAVKVKEWTEEERERKRQLSTELNLGQHLSPGYNLGPWWTAEELALLGTAPDDEIAARMGRTVEAVRVQRGKRGIPTAHDRRTRKGG